MTQQYPFFIRTTVILFGLMLLTAALYYLGDIIIPLAFAGMLAILLNPLCNLLISKKMSPPLAILLALLLAIVVFGCIGYFLSSQMASFSEDIPTLQKKGTSLMLQLQQSLQQGMRINLQQQNHWLSSASTKMEGMAGGAVSGLFGALSVLFLLPVYTYLLLYYKNLLLNFLYEVFANEHTSEVAMVLSQTKQAIQSFMSGLLLEALIVAALNAAALALLGVKYALLLGVIGALLNVLPYIGGIIAIALPVIIATITKDGYQTQLWVIGAYLLIQFIDNNFLVPFIVSSKVKINALVSIVIVLLGGALWGISGMFLSIPFTGIIKIIFDRVPELKPWGRLLGTEMPTKLPGWKRRKVKPKG